MNQIVEAIKNRFSCRAFTGKALTDEEAQALGQAGIQAPSSMNKQRWQVIVVRDKALLAELEAEGTRVMEAMPDKTMYERIQSRGGKLFYNAPCIIYVAIDPAELESALLDGGIVCENIAIAAQGLGLGSCICGLARLAFSPEKTAYFKEKLQFPAGYEFGTTVLVGEAVAAGVPHEPDPGKLTFIG